MTNVFLFPVAVKVYLLSFVCQTYDEGLSSEVTYMTADKSISCDTSKYKTVVATAWVAMTIVVPGEPSPT